MFEGYYCFKINVSERGLRNDMGRMIILIVILRYFFLSMYKDLNFLVWYIWNIYFIRFSFILF